MILGMPCVSADVVGIPSIFTDGVDGILYKGFRSCLNSFDNTCNDSNLEENTENLANAVIMMWKHEESRQQFCKNARYHALKNHNQEVNYQRLIEIYQIISEKKGNK